MNRHEFLIALHEVTQPRTYLETGVNFGQSLTLTRVPSIGIDPDFAVKRELKADIHLARTTSDEFFAREDPMAHLPIDVVDMAFIDGMHLSEYALRDFLAVERFTLPTSIVVFDDMLPRNIDEAARRRHTNAWTGDVYKALEALRQLRPDLIVIEVNTAPTGVGLVLLPDARREGELPGYDDWLDVAMAPDPQDVPEAILKRTHAVKPEKLLASKGWRMLRTLRPWAAKDKSQDEVRDKIRASFAAFAR